MTTYDDWKCADWEYEEHADCPTDDDVSTAHDDGVYDGMCTMASEIDALIPSVEGIFDCQEVETLRAFLVSIRARINEVI